MEIAIIVVSKKEYTCMLNVFFHYLFNLQSAAPCQKIAPLFDWLSTVYGEAVFVSVDVNEFVVSTYTLSVCIY